MIGAGEDISGPLNEAVALLADMAGRDWPASVSLSNGEAYNVPAYDRDALMIEAELCLDWYWPYLAGTRPDDSVRDSFVAAWDGVLASWHRRHRRFGSCVIFTSTTCSGCRTGKAMAGLA
jgi:aminoglycoside/choline kinase family phosphotransferase